MKTFRNSLEISRIAELTGGQYRGVEPLVLSGVGQANEADEHTLIFVEQEKYLEASRASKAGLIICTEAFAELLPDHNLLIVPKPYFALMSLVSMWQSMEEKEMVVEINPTASIAQDATLGRDVSIGANAVIASGAVVGDNCRIGANCYVGENVRLGSSCKLYPDVKIYEDCLLGDRVVIHSGAVIGADGFGFLLEGGRQIKIPQIGNVVIENDVEIGANTCIDRATLGSTIIGEGSKLDNLVQVGHNCVIGKHCILCAQVGLAGSTITGDYVYLAGQVGAAGHLTIGSRAMVGAQSGITNNVPEDARYFGSPARDANTMKRIMAAQMSLPEIYRFYHKAKKQEDN